MNKSKFTEAWMSVALSWGGEEFPYFIALQPGPPLPDSKA